MTKKRLLLLMIPFFALKLFAQEVKDTVKESPFNRFSIELNVGENKAVRPYTPGYFSSDANNYIGLNMFNHYDVGARYMLSNLFGLKLDFAYDVIKNNPNSGSFDFKTEQYRIGIQGVANLGRLLKFEKFSKRMGLLAHAGIEVAQLLPKSGVNAGRSEQNGGVIFGFTPMYRISNRISLTGDFTSINNVRQHLNWDGNNAEENNNLSGLMYNISVGLNFYLGKEKEHADWYIENKSVSSEDKEARKRLDQIETFMNDNDKDGVPNYLDSENNTPSGVAVDSRGRFIDVNRNGKPDELEKQSNDGKDGLSNQSVIAGKLDAIYTLVDKGYVNLFFDVNEDEPNSGSTNNVYHIIKFLRDHPDSKAKLIGYADERGNEVENKILSERRAQKILNIIVASGINANRLSIVGKGVDATFPNTKTGMDLARRVSIILE